MEVQHIKLYNVLLLGITYMLVFTGFNTMQSIQAMIFKSATTPGSGGYVDGFKGDGFTSAAVIYAVFSIASWLSPSVVAWLGPKYSMFGAGVLYAQYIAQLLYPNTYLLYTSAVVIGMAAPVIWTGQGVFLAQNSDPDTIGRNSGLVWALLQSSTFIGSMFTFFMFRGQEYIDSHTRTVVGIVLLSVTCGGTLLMLLFKKPNWTSGTQNGQEENRPNNNSTSPSKALKDSFKLFITRDFLLLSLTFFYTGLQLNIWAGVLPTSVGFSKVFGENRKSWAAICSIFIAVGEVLGGAIFGFLGHVTAKRGRDPIIILGFILSMTSFLLIFLQIPFSATINETSETAFIDPSKYLLMFTSLLMGFSDSCFNTQITSLLGGPFKEQSAPAFAIFKFVQSLSCAIAFFYSSHIGLQWQLLLAVVFDIVGSFAFIKVEWNAQKKEKMNPETDTSCGVEDKGLNNDQES